MTRAAEEGLRRITGLDLFIGQAIDSFEIFTGHRLEPTSWPTWSAWTSRSAGAI